MSKKFDLYGKQFNDLLRMQFVSAVRDAMAEAVRVAVRNTKHDSSQAANYWMVAVAGKTDPTKRTPTSRGGVNEVADIRGESPVGFKRDKGSNAEAVIEHVVAREVSQVIDKYIVGKGSWFPTHISLYNKVGGMTSPGKGGVVYAEAARIESSAHAALVNAKRKFEANLNSGHVKKRFLK